MDTPSKKALWMFILARLSPPHQQYCINQIGIPRSILLGAFVFTTHCLSTSISTSISTSEMEMLQSVNQVGSQLGNLTITTK